MAHTETHHETREFQKLLHQWRRQRHVSQLELALRCDISQKHVSFLESGRSRPSKEMVSLLADGLNIPLRERNALLIAAGFAPTIARRDLASEDMAAIAGAIRRILDQHNPYPAYLVDRLYSVLDANKSARLLHDAARQGSPDMPELVGGNLLDMLFDPGQYRPMIRNWTEVASHMLRRLQGEAMSEGPDPAMNAMIDRLLAYPGVPADWRQRAADGWAAPMLTTDLQFGEHALSMFSTIMTFGTPLDMEVQDLRIEQMFPADDATAQFCQMVTEMSPG